MGGYSAATVAERKPPDRSKKNVSSSNQAQQSGWRDALRFLRKIAPSDILRPNDRVGQRSRRFAAKQALGLYRVAIYPKALAKRGPLQTRPALTRRQAPPPRPTPKAGCFLKTDHARTLPVKRTKTARYLPEPQLKLTHCPPLVINMIPSASCNPCTIWARYQIGKFVGITKGQGKTHQPDQKPAHSNLRSAGAQSKRRNSNGFKRLHGHRDAKNDPRRKVSDPRRCKQDISIHSRLHGQCGKNREKNGSIGKKPR
jgi:hypothetical protein